MFKTITNRIYNEIAQIKQNILSIKLNINTKNFKFIQFNLLQKLKIKY